ncbi:HAD family hydrolase [Sanguibacter sp. HDW7]|uniref:HAD family hydrolase n=1 Tax=Sanguibacter sp. HDW7 TaxID=2714931 RepID=UPI00140AF809|nr:HAD-IA family hydrolase [Sanguibacter sp. HDW7]QIK83325.1 HAD-IA family hydrolase [Sanguibacter sp. HDW7]
MPDTGGTRVTHVLLDADGVLQDVPAREWGTWAQAFVGDDVEEFFARVDLLERVAYAGRTDFLAGLARVLDDLGATADAEEVHVAVWRRTLPVAGSLEVVDALRRNGYGVHLGSNQEPVRAAWMRESFGYDALLDSSHYSCDVGAAKPERAFFDEVVRRLGVEPGSVLLVDDTAENVEGARAAGLAAVLWTVADGHDTLLALLDEHGVDARSVTPAGTSAQR